MNTTVESFISKFDTREAFRLCAAHADEPKCRRYLLRLLRRQCDVAQLVPAVEEIRRAAEAGDPLMQYALARYHDSLQPQPDSDEIAHRYYARATEGGVADARTQLALCYRDGDFGEADMERYRAELQRAIDEGSTKGRLIKIIGQIYGSRGTERHLDEAMTSLQSLIDELDEGETDGQLYCLMGEALRESGNKEAAVQHFEKAIAMGDREAFFHLAYTTCLNDEGEVADRERFLNIMEKAREANASEGYLAHSLTLTPEEFENMEPAEQQHIHDILQRHLPVAAAMGEGVAAFYLGLYYDEGYMGFKADAKEAWRWYNRGADLRQTDCMRAIADKILTHSAPEGWDEGRCECPEGTEERLHEEYAYGYECLYHALLLGDEEALDDVIGGYRNGHLTTHSEAIEQRYMPLWEKQREEEDQDDAAAFSDDYDAIQAARENEIEEDDWGMDPDISTLIEECALCVRKVADCEHDRPWEVAPLAEKLIQKASRLLKDEETGQVASLPDELADWCNFLNSCIADHPRLKLRATELEIALQRRNNARSGTAKDPEQIAELEQYAEWLRHNIALADAGRLDEIVGHGYLRHDPVEWTARWEEVIDQADRRAYATLNDMPRGMGFCFAFWSARHSALLHYGIEWRSPHQMNPKVHFD